MSDSKITYLSVEDLVDIAAIVTGAAPAVRDYGLLASASARPATVVFGQEAYPDLFVKAAALLHSVCVNHALIDGNERTAWAAARVFLSLNGIELVDVDVDDAEESVLAIARGDLREIPEAAARLRRLYQR